MKKIECLLVCVAVVAALACGCATAPKGPSDLELIQSKMKECAAVASAGDIPKLLTYFADNFDSSQLGNKEAFKAFLDSAKDMGYLDGVKIDVKDAKVTIQGMQATIEPVHVIGNFGNGEATFTSTKVKGDWKITGMDISGI